MVWVAGNALNLAPGEPDRSSLMITIYNSVWWHALAVLSVSMHQGKHAYACRRKHATPPPTPPEVGRFSLGGMVHARVAML